MSQLPVFGSLLCPPTTDPMPNGIPDDQTEFPQPPQSLVSQFFATSDNGDSSGAAGSASAAPAPQGACSPERSRWAHPVDAILPLMPSRFRRLSHSCIGFNGSHWSQTEAAYIDGTACTDSVACT